MLPWNQADKFGFTEKWVDAAGFRLHYWEKGEGGEDALPLLVIHGGGGVEIGLAHDLIAQDRPVFCFEVPGFGDDRDKMPSSSEELAHILAAAAEQLGLSQYAVLGTSMGGVGALWLAALYRDKVQAVVLEAPAVFRIQDPPANLGEDPEAFQRAFHAQPHRKPWATEVHAPPNLELLLTLIGPMHDPKLAEALGGLETTATPADSEESAIPFSGDDQPERTPVLILWGTKDGVLPKEAGRAVQAVIPHAHLIYVYDAAHDLNGDRPEAFAEVVRDFLTHGDRFVVRHRSMIVNP